MIEKSFTISTAHAPSEHPDFGSLRVTEHEYGWIVFVAASPTDDTPEWLRSIVDVALLSECTLINFDRDVHEDERFKSYNW